MLVFKTDSYIFLRRGDTGRTTTGTAPPCAADIDIYHERSILPTDNQRTVSVSSLR